MPLPTSHKLRNSAQGWREVFSPGSQGGETVSLGQLASTATIETPLTTGSSIPDTAYVPLEA